MQNIAGVAQHELDKHKKQRRQAKDQGLRPELANVECQNGFAGLEQPDDGNEDGRSNQCTRDEDCPCPNYPYCNKAPGDLDGVLTPANSREGSVDGDMQLDSDQEREEVARAASEGAGGGREPLTPEFLKFKHGYKTREEREEADRTATTEATEQGRRTSKRPVESPSRQEQPDAPATPSLELKKRTKATALSSSEPGNDWGVDEANMDASPEQIGQQLLDIYAHAEPAKVGDVDALIQANAEDLAGLRKAVIGQYGKFNRTMYTLVETFHTFYTRVLFHRNMVVSYALRSEELGFMNQDQYDQFSSNMNLLLTQTQDIKDADKEWYLQTASQHGTTVAMCAVVVTRRSAYICYVAVHRSFRRRGIGSSLVRREQEVVMPNQKMLVTLQQCLEHISSWYANLGFVVEDISGIMQLSWRPGEGEELQTVADRDREKKRKELEQEFRVHQQRQDQQTPILGATAQPEMRVSNNSPVVASDGSRLQPLDLGSAMEVTCGDQQVDEFPVDAWDPQHNEMYDSSSQDSVPLIHISGSQPEDLAQQSQESELFGTQPDHKARPLVSKAILSVNCRFMLQMDCVLEEDKVGGVGWTLMERAAARVDIWNTLVHHKSDRMLGSPTDLEGLINRGEVAMFRILKLHDNPPPDSPDSLDEHQGDVEALMDIIDSSPTLKQTPQWRKMIEVKRRIFKKKGTLDAAEYKEKQRMNAQADLYDRFQ
jgi:ribosomal protein S18 acetylase RimI-like enzyme